MALFLSPVDPDFGVEEQRRSKEICPREFGT